VRAVLRRLLVTLLSPSVVGGGGGDLFSHVWRCKFLLWSFLVLMWLRALSVVRLLFGCV
jgi:hypothetical protein